MRITHYRLKYFWSYTHKTINGLPLEKIEENNFEKHFKYNSEYSNFVEWLS